MGRLVGVCLLGLSTWPLSGDDASRITARGFGRLVLRVALLLFVILGPILVAFAALVPVLPSEGPFNEQDPLSWPKLGLFAGALVPVCAALA